ncbi:hypothetical protein D9M72_595810 [compost metagenome]
MARIVIDRGWRVDLKQFAAHHDRNAVGHAECFCLIVCNVDGWHACTTMQFDDFRTGVNT